MGLNKVKDAVENCPFCGTKITCREKPGGEGYPAKLQWQNEKGDAHYNFDFKTKKNTCNAVCQHCGYYQILDKDNEQLVNQWNAHQQGHADGQQTLQQQSPTPAPKPNPEPHNRCIHGLAEVKGYVCKQCMATTIMGYVQELEKVKQVLTQ